MKKKQYLEHLKELSRILAAMNKVIWVERKRVMKLGRKK